MNLSTARCDVCMQPYSPAVLVLDWLAPQGEHVCLQCWPSIRAQMDTRWDSDRRTWKLTGMEQIR